MITALRSKRIFGLGARARKLWLSLCVLPFFVSTPACAYDWAIEGHVTWIEPTYVPGTINFSLDTGASGCAAGSYLHWNPRGSTEASQIANDQAILSALMTAYTSDRKVRVFGNASNCTIDFVHMI